MTNNEQYLDSLRKDLRKLQDTYGTGVRPHWVSTDEAILMKQITVYEKMVKEEQKCH